MTCFFPLEAWRVEGQAKLVFAWPGRDGFVEALKVPCGQCIGCRLDRSRQWAVRCMHEAACWKHNAYITLTYSPEHLPPYGSLQLRDFQLFMKRLRKRFGRNIRFFHCGEYGAKLGRPHYHACIFNFDFEDKYYFTTINGFDLYRSQALEELWPFGFSTIGEVNFRSAAYVARYILKKVNGDAADHHYSFVDADGQIRIKAAEYVTMSRRPGIASWWLEQYFDDVYPSDGVVVHGKKCKPPRFYDNQLAEVDPYMFDDVKFERFQRAQKNLDSNTQERLNVRHEVMLERLKLLPRPLETD